MQTTSASGAWQYLISARETQTKRDLCQMVWLQGSQCREFKVFVAQPCIFSCCGSRERQICASSCILVTLSGSSRATEAPAHVDAFQVLWGGGPVCLCVFVPLLSGCLLEQAALPSAYVSVATCPTAWESFPWLSGAIPRQLRQQKALSAAGNR